MSLHDDLCGLAAKWLAGTRGCVLVLSDPRCWGTSEQPDAIGWEPSGHSVVIEVKVSRSDFRADKYKPCRKTGRETMGRERWYMAPPGILKADDMPPTYGLLEVRGSRIWRIVPADLQERPGRADAELPLLMQAVRREAWGRGYEGRRVRLHCERTPSYTPNNGAGHG